MYRRKKCRSKEKKSKIKSKEDDKKDKNKASYRLSKNNFTEIEKRKTKNTDFKQELYIKNAKRLTENGAY
jgi:hypothetical protein